MKVLFILGTFPELTQTFILHQITGLIDLGLDIKILAGFNTNQKIVHNEIHKYNLLERTAFFDYSTNNSYRIYKALSLVTKNLLTNINDLKFVIKKKSLHDLFLFDFFLNEKEKYDIVHAHFGQAGILAARIKKRGKFSGKLITSFYGYDISGFLTKSKPGVYNNLFSTGDLFLSLGNNMNNILIDLGCPKEKIKIHHLGINPDQFRIRTPQSSNTIQLLTIARMVEKKGIYYALKAFNIVKSQYTKHKLKYNIIGDGPLRIKYEKMIKEMGLSDHVHLLGPRTQEETRKYLFECNIFILPSITSSNGDIEGTPTSIMEAMSCGKPVISTYHSGIPELINDNESGLLVPEKDIVQLANKILFLLNTPSTWNNIGTNARKHIQSNYNINKLNNDLLNLYNNICLQ